MYSVKV